MVIIQMLNAAKLSGSWVDMYQYKSRAAAERKLARLNAERDACPAHLACHDQVKVTLWRIKGDQ